MALRVARLERTGRPAGWRRGTDHSQPAPQLIEPAIEGGGGGAAAVPRREQVGVLDDVVQQGAGFVRQSVERDAEFHGMALVVAGGQHLREPVPLGAVE